MRGHLTRRGQRSWRLKYDLGTDGAGKRQTRYATLRGTRAEAQAQAAKILATVAEGTHADPSHETVAEFVERWLATWANDNTSHATWTSYSQLLRKHLVARLGARAIQKLRAADLQAVYGAMAAEGLADRTRLHLHRVVHVMLKHATQWGVTARNVAAIVDAPRVRAKEMQVLEPAEMQAVLATLRGKELHPIATARGAPGAALGRCEPGGRLPAGRARIGGDPARSPRSPHWVTAAWRKVAKGAGVRATFHSLRHTHASTLIASGLDVLTISRRLDTARPSSRSASTDICSRPTIVLQPSWRPRSAKCDGTHAGSPLP
jgi:integrase